MASPKPEPPLLCLYHWSPLERRKSIMRNGFVIGSHSIDRAWRPPYMCFGSDPYISWILSGRFHPEIHEWDLWMVFSQDVDGYEQIIDYYRNSSRSYIKEYRVYHSIKKRHVTYVASRTQERVRGD